MFKTFSDFEDVMAEIGARTGATADEMEKMQAVAIQMGRDTVFSATEAAEAMLQLTSSGSSAAEAIQAIPDVLNLAAAGALDLGVAADGVTDVMKQFGLTINDTAQIADDLARAAGSSSATVNDLLQAFANVGPVADAFGLSVNETAAALATLSEAGIKGAEGGTALKSMLTNMTRQTDSVAKAWTKLGVSMFDASGNMRPIDDVFKDINKAMEDMTMEEQIHLTQDLAGSYGQTAFNALRASNGISDMQNSMAGAASAGDVAQARMNTLSGAFKSLMGSVETLAIVMGGLGEGPLVDFIQFLTQIVNGVTAWAQANPQLAQMVMIILGIIAVLGPLLVIIGSIISAIGTIAGAVTTVGAAIGGVSAALPAMGAAFAAIGGPITLLIAALVALGLALNTLFNDPTWQQNAANFGKIIELLVQKVTTWIADLVKNIGQGFQQIPGLIQQAISFFANLGSQIQQVLGGIANLVKNIAVSIIQGLIDGIKSKIQEWFNTIKSLADGAVGIVKKALGIASPSKVMMDFGQQVVAGFNKGVDAMGGLNIPPPTLAGASLGASSTASPTVMPNASAASGANGGGNVYIENLSVPPGTTEEQIRFIMKAIGKEVKRRGGGL